MKQRITTRILLIFAVMLAMHIRPAHADPSATQTFELSQGWNSIFLQVQPEDRDPATVFATLPEGSSVWTYLERHSTIMFIQDPKEGFLGQPGWHVYTNAPDKTFMNNLYAVFAGQAYLVQVPDSDNLTVTGVPTVKEIKWRPNSFNLAGFAVDGDNPPTFKRFFAPSQAHDGQAMYYLMPNGSWTMIALPRLKRLKSGEAYWVYCEGGSDYQGPLSVDLPASGYLNYSNSVVPQEIKITNLSSDIRTVSLSLATSGVLKRKSYIESGDLNPDDNTIVWHDINSLGDISLLPGGSENFKLYVSDPNQEPADYILTIRGSRGTKIDVPVVVYGGAPGPQSQRLFGAVSQAQDADGPIPKGGLWVGSVTLDSVSTVNKRTPDLSFDLRLAGVIDSDVIIEDNSTWQVYTQSEYPGDRWNKTDNDTESGWVNKIPEDWESGSVTYLRTAFDFDFTGREYISLAAKLQRIGGAAIYINGNMIHMDENLVFPGHTTLAHQHVEVSPIVKNIILPANYIKGINAVTNVLAVEIHKIYGREVDFNFSLNLVASYQELLIPFGSHWQVNDSGSRPEGWNGHTYNISSWDNMTAPLGYGDGDNKTAVDNATSAVYFCSDFDIDDKSIYDSFDLSLLCDDGAAVYLNGAEVMEKDEIYRFNMPGDVEIGHDTAPVEVRRASDENRIETITVDGSGLQDVVKNRIAVEVHQHPAEFITGYESESKPLPTPAEFDLRLILHRDGSNTVRLLKEVIQLYDSTDNRTVLLTDHTKIPNYESVVWRDGVPVGRRLSTIGFDFEDDSTDYPGCMQMQQIGNRLYCTLKLPRMHPTNPFRHKFNPDHDNMDPRYENNLEDVYTDDDNTKLVPQEVLEVTRVIDMDFGFECDKKKSANLPPGSAVSIIGGKYSEIIEGLHKEAIEVEGCFELHHVSDVDVLNP